jgi:hypothetical protein
MSESNNFGLTPFQLAALLEAGLKPEEIGGNPQVQHERVCELIQWFSRFIDGNANPKWAYQHAYELAYYIASNGMNRAINTREIADNAYKEGINIKPHERRMFERLGMVKPWESEADAMVRDYVAGLLSNNVEKAADATRRMADFVLSKESL